MDRWIDIDDGLRVQYCAGCLVSCFASGGSGDVGNLFIWGYRDVDGRAGVAG